MKISTCLFDGADGMEIQMVFLFTQLLYSENQILQECYASLGRQFPSKRGVEFCRGCTFLYLRAGFDWRRSVPLLDFQEN